MLLLHNCSKRHCFFIIDIITILRYCYDNVITISYNNRNKHRLLPFNQKTWRKKTNIESQLDKTLYSQISFLILQINSWVHGKPKHYKKVVLLHVIKRWGYRKGFKVLKFEEFQLIEWSWRPLNRVLKCVQPPRRRVRINARTTRVLTGKNLMA